jgi:hypothetical protein
LAIRSLIETIACQRIISRRSLVKEESVLDKANNRAQVLAAKLHTMRKAISPEQTWLREESAIYSTDGE